jgi:hypothetical protein
MKNLRPLILFYLILICYAPPLFSQSYEISKEFGITTGGFSNFPANEHYLTDYTSMVYVAPYIRAGKHEFSAGLLLPLAADGLYFTDKKLSPRLGAIAGYKYYVFNEYGRENMFIHYSFEYLRYSGTSDYQYIWAFDPVKITEKDMFINNVIGVGYNVFFDMNARFGLYYILDYVISQGGYKISGEGTKMSSWATTYIWNNLSNQVGLIFKITSLNKKEKK